MLGAASQPPSFALNHSEKKNAIILTDTETNFILENIAGRPDLASQPLHFRIHVF